MAQKGLAAHKKKARRRGRSIVFLDESGFMLQPTVRRTWAPQGQTPIHLSWDRHDRLSVIAANTSDAPIHGFLAAIRSQAPLNAAIVPPPQPIRQFERDSRLAPRKRSGLFLSFCLVPIETAAQTQQPPVLVIEGGTLIDGNGGAPVRDAVIIIRGNRIMITASRAGNSGGGSRAHADAGDRVGHAESS